MTTHTVLVRNKTGFHIRPAGLFVETASRFRSAIQVVTGGREANGKSVLSLMLLEITPGTEITIRAEGEDEKTAVRTLIELVEGRFGEP